MDEAINRSTATSMPETEIDEYMAQLDAMRQNELAKEMRGQGIPTSAVGASASAVAPDRIPAAAGGGPVAGGAPAPASASAPGGGAGGDNRGNNNGGGGGGGGGDAVDALAARLAALRR